MHTSPEDKRRRLCKPHIEPLTNLVESWREKLDIDPATGVKPFIPDFDPCDGGTEAKMLFLMEKPGRMSVRPQGSGFISQDNQDRTARAIKDFLAVAKIRRCEVVLWNAIVTWNGTRDITRQEREAAPHRLSQLLQKLKKVQRIVLVGEKAAEAFSIAEKGNSTALYPEKVTSMHPSPINQGRRKSEWAKIPDVWKAAAKAAGVVHTEPHDCLICRCEELDPKA